MTQKFCQHLEEYGVQFTRAQAAYQAFNSLVDRVVAGEIPENLEGLLTSTLNDWKDENQALRTRFKELYEGGHLLLPRSRKRPGHRVDAHPKGTVRCSICHREVPRLEFVEWKFAHNGAVNFRGNELPDLEKIPS